MVAKHLSKIIKSDLYKASEAFDFTFQEMSWVHPLIKNEEMGNKNQASGDKNDPSREDNDSIEEEKIGGKLSEIEQEAYEKGFAAGEDAGRILGFKKLDPLEKTLLSLIDEVRHFKETLLKESEEDILTIALAISRQIIRQEVRENPEVIVKNIQTAINKIGQTGKILIRLHPDDLEVITQEAESMIGSTKQEINLRFESDLGLNPGDCIIEGEERMVDGRLKSQLDIFEEVLKKGNE